MQFRTEIGRELVAKAQMLGRDGPYGIGIEDCEVRVGAWDECALST